jgi:predicted ester cyclase
VSLEGNKAVIRRWIEAYNERDMQTEADVRAPSYVAHVSGAPAPLDSEAWAQFIGAFSEAFPDLRLTPEDVVSEGETVAARAAFHGTHRGEFQGIPPTNKEDWIESRARARCGTAMISKHPARGYYPPSSFGPDSGSRTLAPPHSTFTPAPDPRPTFTNRYILISSRYQLPHVVDNLWISDVQHERTHMRVALM